MNDEPEKKLPAWKLAQRVKSAFRRVTKATDYQPRIKAMSRRDRWRAEVAQRKATR